MKKFIFILIGQILLVWIFVVMIDRQPDVPSITYEDALAQTSTNLVAWITRDTPEESAAWERFKSYWQNLSEENVREVLPQVYAENVWFNDTVKTITNRAELLDYMLHTASMVNSTTVRVRDIAYTEQGYYVRWEMRVEPKNPRYGTEWKSIGLSHIRLNAAGEVILHQDYWDSAAGLYEHFPVLGWMIRNIKARL